MSDEPSKEGDEIIEAMARAMFESEMGRLAWCDMSAAMQYIWKHRARAALSAYRTKVRT